MASAKMLLLLTCTMIRKPGATAVGIVSIGSGIVAVFMPETMYSLWPHRTDSNLRFLQAWGIGSVGLGTALCGASVESSTIAVASVSILWDVCFVPEPQTDGRNKEMGYVAAAINALSIGLLLLDMNFN